MAISNNKVLTWIGIADGAQRNEVGGNFIPLPQQLENLTNLTEIGIVDACAFYQRAHPTEDRLQSSRVVIKRLISLIH